MQHQTLDQIKDNAVRVEVAMEAVVNRTPVEVVYNGSELTLHPHQLFLRHNAIYVRAFSPFKCRRHDEQPKLGDYKVAGLAKIALSEGKFDPLSSFDGRLPNAEDRSLVDVLSSQ